VHDVAPGEQPHRSTGQSDGTIVHTFFAPPEASNSPFTSQNGYAGFVQSESALHAFCSFVHAAVVIVTASNAHRIH
jgi:hypothetical protein